MSYDVNDFLIDRCKTVKQAMRQMNELGEKEIFVVHDGRLLTGSLSDGDIRKWILKEGNLETRVDQICNKTPKTVRKDCGLEHVRHLMLTLKIESVPVINEDNAVEAILTWDNVFAGKLERHREKLNVPVVIMAGGKGSRLDPFTKILPKPLIPIGEKPIIELIMDRFAAYDVKDFYIAVFHKARMIKSYFEDMNDKYRISYVEEEVPLGTVGALSLLKGRLNSTFLVTNCDVIVESDYAEIVRFHQEHDYDLTLVVSCRHYMIPYGVCELENGGTLRSIKEKPEYDLLVNTGMYVMNPRVLEVIPPGRSFDIIDLIAKAKTGGCKIGVFPINEKAWIDVGQWEEYYKSVQDLHKRLE